MEKFSTLLTENYNLEQGMKEYISTLTEYPEEMIVTCSPDELYIKFIPNFGNSFGKMAEIFEDLTKYSGDYIFVGKTNINENIFEITLKKAK